MSTPTSRRTIVGPGGAGQRQPGVERRESHRGARLDISQPASIGRGRRIQRRISRPSALDPIVTGRSTFAAATDGPRSTADQLAVIGLISRLSDVRLHRASRDRRSGADGRRPAFLRRSLTVADSWPPVNDRCEIPPFEREPQRRIDELARSRGWILRGARQRWPPRRGSAAQGSGRARSTAWLRAAADRRSGPPPAVESDSAFRASRRAAPARAITSPSNRAAATAIVPASVSVFRFVRRGSLDPERAPGRTARRGLVRDESSRRSIGPAPRSGAPTDRRERKSGHGCRWSPTRAAWHLVSHLCG